VRIRLVTVRLRKDGSVTDEKPYDPENVTRPKEQRARFLTETDCNHLRDIMWLKRAAWQFWSSGHFTGPRRRKRCYSHNAHEVRTPALWPAVRPGASRRSGPACRAVLAEDRAQ
jgi:hypothetical protein